MLSLLFWHILKLQRFRALNSMELQGYCYIHSPSNLILNLYGQWDGRNKLPLYDWDIHYHLPFHPCTSKEAASADSSASWSCDNLYNSVQSCSIINFLNFHESLHLGMKTLHNGWTFPDLKHLSLHSDSGCFFTASAFTKHLSPMYQHL